MTILSNQEVLKALVGRLAKLSNTAELLVDALAARDEAFGADAMETVSERLNAIIGDLDKFVGQVTS